MNEILYLIMRNDLPSMNPGKLAAQAAHCANAFIKKFGKIPEVKKWERQTDQGFGTTIVLGGSFIEICDVYHDPNSKYFYYDIVLDPTYPSEIDYEIGEWMQRHLSTENVKIILDKENKKATLLRSENIGMYIFGEKNSIEKIGLLEYLNLYP